MNAVFSDILTKAEAQVLNFVESIEPVADLSESAGMTVEAAWKRTAICPKSLFDSIHLIRNTIPKNKNARKGGSMLWGAMKACETWQNTLKKNNPTLK